MRRRGRVPWLFAVSARQISAQSQSLNNASRRAVLRDRGVRPLFQAPGLPVLPVTRQDPRTRARAAFPAPRARAEVPPGHTCILPPPPAAARRGQANTPRTRQTAQDGRQPVRPPHLEGPAVHGPDAHRLQSFVWEQLHEGEPHVRRARSGRERSVYRRPARGGSLLPLRVCHLLVFALHFRTFGTGRLVSKLG